MLGFIILLIIVASALGYLAYRSPDFKTRLAAFGAAIVTFALAFWEQVSGMWS